ncbi:helix-turn-helix transcriptional regulator [Bacillus altitudinis]|uniref:helix-turn-helix domain-containing protein n=1 Tax=Bacillus altitudinis TaxID=293387 RepID=UPI00227E98ED|nr:helix-turn-helix transcriptional regulator [Bacillus altitudinis]MCY7627735.1 helix-turn-helix transcriptional regulator [Bacillus altitudinis]MDX2363615.1 helix-turn-helix transcriptional regulator [Bacillus altitudinis]
MKLLTKIVKTRLKEILDERGLSIRGFAFGNDLSFETVRRLYNNTAKQYQRETLGNICEALDIKIEDLLYITEDDSKDS